MISNTYVSILMTVFGISAANIKQRILFNINTPRKDGFHNYDYIWILVYTKYLFLINDPDVPHLAYKLFYVKEIKEDNLAQFRWFKEEINNLLDAVELKQS